MSTRKNQEMKERLIRERDLLIRQREAIENQIAGIERAIALVGADTATEPTPVSGKRTQTKGIVLDLLKESGTTGLNAQRAVEMANLRGITLDRNTVSSLLSRLKKDEIVVYDGDRYKLKSFARRAPTDWLNIDLSDETNHPN